MVESAFEFADICREQDYHNFLFSMKVGGSGGGCGWGCWCWATVVGCWLVLLVDSCKG